MKYFDFSIVILSLLLIQGGQLSVSGKECTSTCEQLRGVSLHRKSVNR